MHIAGEKTRSLTIPKLLALVAFMLIIIAALTCLSSCGPKGVYVLVKDTIHYDVANSSHWNEIKDIFQEQNPGKDPVEIYEYSRDDAGNMTQWTFTDVHGGQSEYTVSYDEYGNRVAMDCVEFYGSDDFWYAKPEYEVDIDENGRCVERTYEAELDERGFTEQGTTAASYSSAGLISSLRWSYTRNNELVIREGEYTLGYSEQGYLAKQHIETHESATDKLRELWNDPEATLFEYQTESVLDEVHEETYEWEFGTNKHPVSLTTTTTTIASDVVEHKPDADLPESSADDASDSEDTSTSTIYFETDEHGNIVKVFNEDHELYRELEYEFIENPSPMVVALDRDVLHGDTWLLRNNYI